MRSAPRPARRPYRSARAALVWYELRLHGRAVSVVVTALVCAPLLVLAFVVEPGGSAGGAVGIAHKLVLLAVTIMLLAALGPLFGNFASNRYEAYPMPSFFASLPLSTGDIAWAKLGAAAVQIAAIALLSAAVVAGVAAFAGFDPAWHAFVAPLRDRYGAGATGVLTVLGACWLLSITVGLAINGVWVTLVGRKRAWHVVNAVILAFFFAAVLIARWINGRPESAQALLDAVPNALVFAAAVKIGLLAFMAYLAGVRRLYPWRRIAGVWVAWIAAVTVGALLVLQHPLAGAVSTLTVMLVLIVGTPVLGIVAAPFALALNRTR